MPEDEKHNILNNDHKSFVCNASLWIKCNSHIIFCLYLLILSPLVTTVITEYTNHNVNRLCSTATNCAETHYDTINLFVYANEAFSFLFSIFSSLCGLLVLLKRKSLHLVIYTYFTTYALFLLGDYIAISSSALPSALKESVASTELWIFLVVVCLFAALAMYISRSKTFATHLINNNDIASRFFKS